jgi:hypothetical protein
MKGEYSISLAIKTKSVRPEEITALLGISPSLVRAIGETNPLNNRPYIENLWLFSLQTNIAADITNHAHKLVNLFASKIEEIRALSSSGDVWLSVSGKVDDITIMLSLPNEFFAFAVEGGIRVDFAMHVFGPTLDELTV